MLLEPFREFALYLRNLRVLCADKYVILDSGFRPVIKGPDKHQHTHVTIVYFISISKEFTILVTAIDYKHLLI